MRAMKFRNLDQNKAFIKNEAQRLGISVGAAYSTYYSRMLLERLASINYGNIVVKGSFSQYVHLNSLSRPVLDIDLSSSLDHHLPITLLYRAIYEAEEDVVTFDVNSLPRQTKNGVYKIPVIVKIKYPDDKREIIIPVPVDYKESNSVIFETQLKGVEPLFEGEQKFFINVPSFEEHIAEKLYIIAHCRRSDIQNTRVKDFYDIYKLHGKEYDSDKFSLYFQMMLLMYGEDLQSITSTFLNKTYMQNHEKLWQQMKRKYEFADQDLEFAEAMYYTKAVLNEQIQKIASHQFTDQAMKLVREKKKDKQVVT